MTAADLNNWRCLLGNRYIVQFNSIQFNYNSIQLLTLSQRTQQIWNQHVPYEYDTMKLSVIY